MRSMHDRVNDLIGVHFQHKGTDYGIITTIEQLIENGDVRYIAVTDKYRKIDAYSIMRLLNRISQQQRNIQVVTNVDGAAYNQFANSPKKLYSASPACVAQINDLGDGYSHNVAKIGDERIRINKRED